MCIIVDTNCLANVFDPDSALHSEFEPVFKWITEDIGFIVIGGTKYIDELKGNKAILKYIKTLNTTKSSNRNRQVLYLDDCMVDAEEKRVKSIITDKNFDDPHLAAMAIVAKCMLICSLDMRSVKFVKSANLYNSKGMKAPKYYTGSRNKKLLCDKYIDKRYK